MTAAARISTVLIRVKYRWLTRLLRSYQPIWSSSRSMMGSMLATFVAVALMNESPASERETESDLPDTLLRTPEVAGEVLRLHQRRIGLIRQRARRDNHACLESARVDRVEQVEDLADRFDVGTTGEVDDFRHPQVQLLLLVAPPAVDGRAEADVLDGHR